MKIPLRKSEWFFITSGSILALTASVLLFTGITLIPDHPEISEDPFLANYVSAPIPTPAPETEPGSAEGTANAVTSNSPQATATATPTPSPTPATLDANGVPIAMKNIQKAYLLFPAARAVLTKTGNPKKGYPIKFKFEVDPKDTPCAFTLNFKGELVISKPLKGSPTGSYEVSILIRKPGLYTWQIKTETFESEVREVTIR